MKRMKCSDRDLECIYKRVSVVTPQDNEVIRKVNKSRSILKKMTQKIHQVEMLDFENGQEKRIKEILASIEKDKHEMFKLLDSANDIHASIPWLSDLGPHWRIGSYLERASDAVSKSCWRRNVRDLSSEIISTVVLVRVLGAWLTKK